MLNKLSISIRNFGILKTFHRALLKIASPALYYQKEILFGKNINGKIRKINPKIDVIIRKATKRDGFLFEKAVSKDYKEDFLKRMKEDECFIAVHKGNLAHIAWLTYNDFLIRNMQITARVNKNEAYIFDCSTPKKFKGKGIYPSVIQYVLSYLKNKNIKKALISTSSDNYPSQKGILKTGFRKIKTATYIKFLNIFIWKKDFEKKIKICLR